jgi:hypothetical protein
MISFFFGLRRVEDLVLHPNLPANFSVEVRAVSEAKENSVSYSLLRVNGRWIIS